MIPEKKFLVFLVVFILAFSKCGSTFQNPKLTCNQFKGNLYMPEPYFCLKMFNGKNEVLGVFSELEKSFFILDFTGSRIIQKIPMKDIVGVHPLSTYNGYQLSKDRLKRKFGFVIGMISETRRRFVTQRYFLSIDNEKEEKKLVDLFTRISFTGKFVEDGSSLPERKMLVIMNPVSGAKKGVQIFRRKVKPIFDFAPLTYDVIVTESAGHATEIIKNLDLRKHNEIVSVGGDGLIHEIVQGLFHHPKIQYPEMKKIPINIIPAGTGNALSWQSGSDLDPVLAALIAVRGRTTPLDVQTIISSDSIYLSFLFFGYGVIPDIDFGYEPFKFLGDAKYLLGAVHSIITLPHYNIEVKYAMLEDEDYNSLYRRPTQFTNRYVENEEIQMIVDEDRKKYPRLKYLNQAFGEELDDMLKNHSNLEFEKESETEEEENRNTVVKKIEEGSLYFAVTNVRKISYDFWASNTLSEGIGRTDLVHGNIEVDGLKTWWEGILTFFKMIGEEGNYREDRFWTSDRIKAFVFTPKGPTFSMVDIDGEERETKTYMGEVHRQLLSFTYREG